MKCLSQLLVALSLGPALAFRVHEDLLAFPQYEVHLLDNPPDAEETTGREGESAQEQMMLDGRKYKCEIPVVKASGAAGANETTDKAEQEKELARATDRGWELLDGMKGHCIYYVSGWWSYKFCYGKSVRQFHQKPFIRGMPVYPPVEDPNVEAYELGVALQKPAAKTGELVQRGEIRYLVQHMDGGTECDLTSKSRTIEVQFHCNPQSADRIALIKEISICSYLMVVQTPRLCNDVAFLPAQQHRPNTITCTPKDYRPKLKETDTKAAEVDTDHSPNDYIADIKVGGRVLIPKGVKIEKSAIVGGGREKYIDTVATSGGLRMSAKELDRKGLGNRKEVDLLAERLEKLANGQGWTLEVYDTPEGREYRAVLGDEPIDVGEDDKEQATDDKDTETAAVAETESETEQRTGEAAQAKETATDSKEKLFHEEL
ncbi:hypothetical protein K470DRAFT_265483 [Piedraia hortae CBS 480.64]|uniref:Endoplasmic reticulum lectin n=1 Tax=Piedraia hortae CBS 480.64 TaxID=1314780 RepID=A0A6A7BX70_9PEZI|nr:hypothetical protein K470DRAFT_265483 [Piedraia hortae CBS 480.64]